MSSASTRRWHDYRPAKGMLVWSFLGGVVATLVVGFTVFDWRTAGSASELAADSARQAEAQLVSAICVERFLGEPDSAARLVELKATDSWSQDDFIDAGGWAQLTSREAPVRDAAKMCAEALVEM